MARRKRKVEPIITKPLMISYPLRKDFVASVEIPRNMTKEEAERLAKFVQTLAIQED